MKTYLVITALSILTILNTSAQDDPKLRRDVTYSVHNYKHPNKAAAARQWSDKKGVAVNPTMPNQGPAVSYKHQAPGTTPVGGIVTSHTPKTDVTLRNYKIQRVREPRPASSSDYWDVTTSVQQKQPSIGGN